MSDPAIRAALEAAQREASSFYSLPETAAIVAAFLRALPRSALHAHGFLTADAERLAAAVERAAKG